MPDSASDPGRLAALRRYEIFDTPAEPAFDRVADLAAHLLDTPMAGIHFVDDQCQWAKAQVGLDAQQLDLDVAFCAHALDMEEILIVENAADDPRFRDNPLVTGDPGIRFYASAPLITPDGYALGRLCVIDTAPRRSGLGAKERETLRQLAGVVMDELAYRAPPRHREELRLMSRAVEEATEAVIITGPALDAPGPRIEYVNPAFERMTGYAAEEVIGQTPRILQGPATDRETLDDVRRHLAAGESVAGRTTVNYRKNGTPYWVEWNITPVRGPDGAVQHWVSVQRDVTEQRQRQDALRQERNLLARIFEASAAAITVVDTNGQIIRANGRAEEVLGLAPGTVKERTYDDPAWAIEAVDGGPFPHDELPFVRVMTTEAPVYDVRHAIAWPDGQRRILSINGAPLQDQAGAVVGVVFAITDVTDEYERREALKEQRERLEMALVGGHLGMWDVNFNEGRNVVDERWAAMLGYALDEMRDRQPPFESHVHPDDLERAEAEMARHARGEIPYVDLEIRMRHQDGSWRWVLDRGKIVEWNDDGSPRRAVGTHMDITERKEAERELRRQRDLLENIFDASPAAIVTLNAEGQFTSASPRGQEVLGLTPSAVSERAFNDPEWRITDEGGRSMPYEELPFARVIATGAPIHDVDVSIERPDGTRRLLAVSGAPLQGPDGQPDGAVFVLDDITEQKRRMSLEQRLGRLLEATPSEIYVFDAETLRFVQTSRGARANLGYAADALAAMTPLDFKPYDRAEFEARLQPLRTGEAELVTFETTHRRKDGTTYPVEVRLQLSREETRPVFIAIVLDITERTRRERELVDAKERAEEMSRLKSAFLANMSHEIRTPLTSIIGFADVLGGQVEGTARELIGMIRESGKRLEETLTSVLDLAKIEGEAMRVHPDRVDLAEEVRTAVGIFRPEAEAKGLALRVDVPDGPATATLDPRALRRVLSNLLSNAVKFTDEGRVTARLRLHAAEAVVEVEDTGVGIAPGQLDRIFEEFVQESAGFTREYEGVGLGLSITRRLVQLLGGTVEAESEKGQGSVFRVRLPREHLAGADHAEEPFSQAPSADAAQPAAPAEASPPGKPAAKGDAARILLVEDNALTCRVLPMLLQQADARYTMDVAERGEDALEQAEARGYDLFIIDINLGAGLTGLDVMRRLRELPRYAQTPMVACTAYAMPGDEEQFLEAGFDAYLAKPFRAEDLLSALERAAD